MPVVETTQAECRVFEALGETCGVFLWTPATNDHAFRFRQDWEQFAGEEAEEIRAIAEDLPSKLEEMGPRVFLQWVDQTLSNTFRVSEPATVMCHRFDRTLQSLYRKYVHSTVQQFVTHLPFYPVEACAGGFGRDKEVLAEDWLEAEVPGRRSLSQDLFVVRIHGRSMESDDPKTHIPNGSLCVFRWYRGGSRQGIYLVERIGVSDQGGEVTVKRYQSQKESTAEGWRHKAITMKPGNKEYSEWGLEDGEQYKTLAEFVCVLEDPS